MGGNINFGSRTEFLPGDRPDDIDIKYERYGGCFVSYKRALLYVLLSLLFTGIVAYLVYHYFSCKHNQQTTTEEADNFLSEVYQTAKENELNLLDDSSKISDKINPLYYKLKIRPYLDEAGPKNFSFEGQVFIVFEIKNTPTSTIILNAKDLEIPETEISVKYTSKSKVKMLASDSQIKENLNDTVDTQTLPSTVVTASNETVTEVTKNVTTTEAPVTTLAPQESQQINTTNTENQSEVLVSSPSPTTIPTNSTSSESSEKPDVIIGSDEINLQIMKQKYNEKDETYTIKLKVPLEKGVNYTLHMKFSGKISDRSGGILRSSYKQENNTNDNSSGWMWDHFKPTPPMATHSVAFAVFKLTAASPPSSGPYPLTKVWGRDEIKNKTEYTLQVAPKLLKTYNNYFGYNYSLNKIDLVAVPNLPVGAYGSWGILFFRESELLATNDSSFETKEHLLHIVSRELAQEWFGNLISVHSWTDSWLTEIISNYVHYIGINSVEPTWEIMTETLITDVQDVLNIDSMDLLPRITSLSANFEKDFDQQLILSNKGSSIVNMLNFIMTKEEFNARIKKFVDKWKYKKFEQNNFWEEFDKIPNLPSGITIKDVTKLWITQKGFPLVTIIRNENKSLTIQQTKFSEFQTESDKVWMVPLNYTSTNENNTVWLTEKSPKLMGNLVEKENDSWIFFSSPAPCRINYDLDNWNALISLLKDKPETLSPTNRAQLLDDAFHLARTGLLNYGVVLNMTLYLEEKEHDLVPWITALKNLQFLNDILSKTPNYGFFQDHVLQLLKPMYDKLITDESNTYKIVKLKKLIVEWSCRLNYQPCRLWAHEEFNTWIQSLNPDTENKIPKEFRPIVYCIGAQYLGRTGWDFLRKRYQNTRNNPEESKALITGMSCVTESWLLMKHFYKALEDETLQNSILMWTSLSSEIAVNSAFEFLKENWSQVYSKYKHSELAIRQILHGVLSKLTTDNDLQHVLNFFVKEKVSLKNFAHDMIVIIEKLKHKIVWKQSQMTSFKLWFLKNK